MGGTIGLGIGAAGVALASRRYPAFRSLTIPFRVFLASSSATFVAIVAADRASRNFETSRHAQERTYISKQESIQNQIEAAKPRGQRMKEWATANRYGLLFGAWVVSMGGSWYLVNRNSVLSSAQKLVQARVYAQGLTVGLLVGSFALESGDALRGKGRWETVKILDPNDPTHKNMIEKKVHHERYQGEDQWMDMVAAEEQKMKEREERQKQKHAREEKNSKDAKAA